MPEPHPPAPPAAETGHETRDINVRAVLAFGIGLMVLVGLVSLLLAGLFHLFLIQENAEKASQLPLAEELRRQQTNPLDRLPYAGVPGDPSTREPRLEGIDPNAGRGGVAPPGWPAVPLRSGVPGWESNAQELLRRDRAVLDSYGWVDREKKIVRIPIDQAIDLTAERLGKSVPGGKR